ncbi:MAG: hypothetical protein LBE09_04585 [Christensenellaceae bacterium]|jgi:hypothetical protein|nr:hypothetical protein [Christensenellaceae bacterium]
MNTIAMLDLLKVVNDKYVGFNTANTGVRPAEVANGIFKTILNVGYVTNPLARFTHAIWDDGTYHEDYDLINMKSLLSKSGAMSKQGISDAQLSKLRVTLQDALSTGDDSGLNKANQDKITVSFNAGSAQFMPSYGINEDAGEFIASLIKDYCPDLSKYISGLLRDINDPITLACLPLLPARSIAMGKTSKYKKIEIFAHPNERLDYFIDTLVESSICLEKVLSIISNKFAQLRIFVSFCIFEILRYMSQLAYFYDKSDRCSLFIDCTKNSNLGVVNVSGMSFSQVTRMLNTFYSWGLSQILDDLGFTKEDLISAETPVLKLNRTGRSRPNHEPNIIWKTAKEVMKELSEDDARFEAGQAISDIMAFDSTYYPMNYFSKIGTSLGLVYPRDNLPADRHLELSSELLEMLISCCIKPDEVIDKQMLLERLYYRFSIVIVDETIDRSLINSFGDLVYVDSDDLGANYNAFFEMLDRIGITSHLSCGVLRICLGGKNVK